MTLKIHDTATRTLREFNPLEPGKVGIYLCGATVQAPPHVGHIRSGIAFDVVRRWLSASGLEVTFIRNVTDIDDKIIHNAGHSFVESCIGKRLTRRSSDQYVEFDFFVGFMFV